MSATQAQRSTLKPEVDRKKQLTDMSIIALLVGMMAMLLNHTDQIAGLNMSLADPFLVLVLFGFVVTKRFFAFRYSVIFFCVLIAVSVVTTLFITPLRFEVLLGIRGVMGDFIKLIISFMYFIVGTNIARSGLTNVALKWFAVGAALVASIGVLLEAAGIRAFWSLLYFSDFRYTGFMSDPNFYAVLACAGIAYFAYTTQFHPFLRGLAIFVLAVSVILSGSKTGMVSLVILTTLILVTRTTRSGKIGPAVVLVGLAVGLVVFFNPILETLIAFSNRYSTEFPQLERLSSLLGDDPTESISGSGSQRASMWSAGLGIIGLSPIFGVGIGTYTQVSRVYFGVYNYAHNTFIQIGAEWGLVLAFILFGWILYLLFRASQRSSDKALDVNTLILRETIVVFLIGSMSLSLNNARMFWMFLGILAYLCFVKGQMRKASP
ncbi:O-antigen ligase family protein [Corynebacterium sp. S7]